MSVHGHNLPYPQTLSFECKDVRRHTKRELPEYESPQEGSGTAKDQPIVGGCLALNAPWGIGWKSDSSEHRLDYSKYKLTVSWRILTCGTWRPVLFHPTCQTR